MNIETEIKDNAYAAIESSLLDNFNLISDRCPVEIDLIQEVLGDLYNLITTDGVSEEPENEGSKYRPRILIPPLFAKNLFFLIAAYKLMLLGLNNPSNSTLRTVLEGITQIYLIHATKNEAELIYKREMDILTDDEKIILKKNYRYMSAGMVRDLLYTGEKKRMMDDLYNGMSNVSHPSIKGLITDMELTDDFTNDAIYVILAFGTANIIAFLEVYSDRIDENIIENSKKLLDKCAKAHGGVVDIVPNQPSILEKLTLTPDPDLY